MKKLTGVFLACLLAVSANAQVYVSVEGAGLKDGSGWDNAMDNVAGALVKARAATVKEVWIAGGTYPATDAWGALNANMKGVTVYGGFKGDETSPTARAKKAGGRAYEFTNPTIINALTTIAASVGTELPCILDGMTWAGQTATFGFRNNVIIRNCIWVGGDHTNHIVNAYLTDAATVSNVKSGAVEGCLFLNNKGTSGSNVIQISVTAGLPFEVKDCDFIGNTVTHRVITGGANVYVSNCRFINNEAGSAAGYVINAGANSQVVNCLISNNAAPHAVFNGAIQVVNSTIANNLTPSVFTWSAGSKVYNTILLGNVDAAGASVGITGKFAGEVKNSAYSVALPDTTAVVAENNLLFSTTFKPFVAPSTFAGYNAAKQAELLDADWSLTNKPHGLINAGNNEFFTGSFIGTTTTTTTTDVAGNARIQNTTIDLGAYENAIAAPALPTLTTVAGEGGTIEPVLSASPRRMGELIVLSATQNEGKEFANWTNQGGTVLSDKANFTYEMPEISTTLKGNFQERSVPHLLTVVAQSNGSVSTTGGEYYSGEKVEITAIPNADYKFAAWTDKNGKVLSYANPYVLTMERQDTLVKAFFKHQSLTRYLVSPNTVDKDDPAPVWQRATVQGETIINLNEVMVNGEKKTMTLDDFFVGNHWPLPLSAGDEIWLLGGAYPTYQAIEVTATGTKIYGGFEGTETDLNQRIREDLDGNGVTEPWEFAYLSILSGQMQEAEIASSVLLAHADDLLIDGLVVEGGRQGAVDYGVGVNLGIRSNPVSGAIMRNSIIRRNLVTGGAGATAYVNGAFVWSKSILEGSLIENNMIDATNTGPGYGAGICVGGGTVKNCVVRNNRNLAGGAGNVQGGGIRVGTGLVLNCVVNNNFAQRGGGVYLLANDNAILRYSTVVNNQAAVSGAGVYFRGNQTTTGGIMQNTVVWNNAGPTDPTSDIFIETNATTGKFVKLGALAYNSAKTNVEDHYTPLNGNAASLKALPSEGVFNSPLSTVGFNESDMWESDWSPKLAGLGIAIPFGEDEKDILGRPRKEGEGAIGAFEFGSPLSINKGKVDLDPFVYCTHGQLRVSFYQPVTVEIYDLTGALIQTATAKNDHAFNLTKNAIYTVVVKAGDLSCSKKIAVQ